MTTPVYNKEEQIASMMSTVDGAISEEDLEAERDEEEEPIDREAFLETAADPSEVVIPTEPETVVEPDVEASGEWVDAEEEEEEDPDYEYETVGDEAPKEPTALELMQRQIDSLGYQLRKSKEPQAPPTIPEEKLVTDEEIETAPDEATKKLLSIQQEEQKTKQVHDQIQAFQTAATQQEEEFTILHPDYHDRIEVVRKDRIQGWMKRGATQQQAEQTVQQEYIKWSASIYANGGNVAEEIYAGIADIHKSLTAPDPEPEPEPDPTPEVKTTPTRKPNLRSLAASNGATPVTVDTATLMARTTPTQRIALRKDHPNFMDLLDQDKTVQVPEGVTF